MKKQPIDTQWFLAQMARKKTNIRQLAMKMRGLEGRLDYASLYRMIHGQRGMSLSEAMQLADALEQPLEEIARRALGKKR